MMLSIAHSGKAALLCGAMFIWSASAAYATPTVTTTTWVSLGNDSDPGQPGSYLNAPPVDPHSSNTGAAISSQYTDSFTGLNSTGTSQTMNVEAGAKASAEFGQLKVSSKLHLDTPFSNAANAPYVRANYSVNTNGTPDFLGSDAYATFQDTLSLTGTGVSTLKLIFHLDGNVTGNIPSSVMAAGLFVTDLNTQERYYGSYALGPVDTDVVMSLDVTDPSSIDLAIQMHATSYAFLNLNQLGYDESQNYVEDANFYDTLALTGITAFDGNNNPITLTGLTGASGTNYLALVAPPPSNNGVPEPATLALMGAGLAGLRLRKRKHTGK